MEGDGLPDGLSEATGDALAEGLTEGDALPDGLSEATGEGLADSLAEALVDASGDPLARGLREASPEALGDGLGIMGTFSSGRPSTPPPKFLPTLGVPAEEKAVVAGGGRSGLRCVAGKVPSTLAADGNEQRAPQAR